MQLVDALNRAIQYLDRELAPSTKLRAFQQAANAVREIPAAELLAFTATHPTFGAAAAAISRTWATPTWPSTRRRRGSRRH